MPIILTENSDIVFKKSDLVNIVKSIGERVHQSDVKQAWNRTHKST